MLSLCAVLHLSWIFRCIYQLIHFVRTNMLQVAGSVTQQWSLQFYYFFFSVNFNYTDGNRTGKLSIYKIYIRSKLYVDSNSSDIKDTRFLHHVVFAYLSATQMLLTREKGYYLVYTKCIYLTAYFSVVTVSSSFHLFCLWNMFSNTCISKDKLLAVTYPKIKASVACIKHVFCIFSLLWVVFNSL